MLRFIFSLLEATFVTLPSIYAYVDECEKVGALNNYASYRVVYFIIMVYTTSL